MIAFSVLFSITLIIRILFGVFADRVSWFQPILSSLTGLCIFFGIMAVLFIIFNIIKTLRK